MNEHWAKAEVESPACPAMWKRLGSLAHHQAITILGRGVLWCFPIYMCQSVNQSVLSSLQDKAPPLLGTDDSGLASQDAPSMVNVNQHNQCLATSSWKQTESPDCSVEVGWGQSKAVSSTRPVDRLGSAPSLSQSAPEKHFPVRVRYCCSAKSKERGVPVFTQQPELNHRLPSFALRGCKLLWGEKNPVSSPFPVRLTA